jgi:hypothetical protein
VQVAVADHLGRGGRRMGSQPPGGTGEIFAVLGLRQRPQMFEQAGYGRDKARPASIWLRGGPGSRRCSSLIVTGANLLPECRSFAELEAACLAFCDQVNARPHRITRRAPAEMLAEERARLHPVPAAPFTMALA